MQGIFTRRLRKRIDANKVTHGQTKNKRTNSQAEYNAVPKMARAPQYNAVPKMARALQSCDGEYN